MEERGWRRPGLPPAVAALRETCEWRAELSPPTVASQRPQCASDSEDMRRQEALQRRHAGDAAAPSANRTCLLLANGPSLNALDWAHRDRWLRRFDIVVGMNRIYLATERYGLHNLDAYVAFDSVLVRQAAADILALRADVKFVPIEHQLLFPCDAWRHNLVFAPFVHMYGPWRFATSVRQGLSSGYTVTYAALQLLFAMGCGRVAITGLDHRWKGDDHFDREYFANASAATARFAEATNMRGGPGARQLRKIERYYRRARTAYEKAGRTLVDATPNGSCTVFRKVASVEAALEAFGMSG